MSKSLKVLLVEDSEPDAKLLLYELGLGNYDPICTRVETPEAMAEALSRQEWDLVIADYVMPRFSGLAALKLLQERGLDLPFIIVSGKIGEDVAVEAMKAGAHDYILKDNLARLNPAIERELRDAAVRRERRQAEAELAATQQQLFQAQKMEAVGQIAASMAHEINNRLTVVMGYLDLCLRRVTQNNATHQALLTVRKNVQLAGKLSNQLLLFGQKQLQFKAPININHNIREMRDLLKRRLIDDNIFLRFDLGRNLWTVLADSPNIDQVIINLVLNARDAMPFGGMINIKTENIYLEKKAATGLEGARGSGSPARARYVCLTVSDNGNGMDESVRSRIFEPFFTTKERGRGTGLGLSVLYGIVQSHEGSIDVFSRPGAGSTFKIFLPALRYKFQSLGGKDKESPHEQFYDQEKRILLVEDDPEVLSLTRKVLKKNGYLVFSCRTAADALAIFEQEKGCFDLVVCDIILPDSRGTDLVLKLKQREPSLEVLLVSGFVGEQPALEEIRQQGIPFIPKPYTFEDLLQQIRRQSLHRQL